MLTENCPDQERFLLGGPEERRCQQFGGCWALRRVFLEALLYYFLERFGVFVRAAGAVQCGRRVLNTCRAVSGFGMGGLMK